MKLLSAILNLVGMSPALTKPGIAEKDVWRYLTRPGEASSTLTILKIEEINGKEVVHIRLDGLKVKSIHSPTGFFEEIEHLPFSRDSLIGNLTKKIKTVSVLPDFYEAYNHWKNDVRAGVYNIPVRDAVSSVERIMNQS